MSSGERLSCGDSIVDSVILKFTERSKLGQAKYGHTLDRSDLKVHDWITHAQEELMDGILYLEKLKHATEFKTARAS
jgi:hypothetical protein